MMADDATLTVIDALNESGIPYMMVGSFSSNFYGIPRSTQDADIVIEAPSQAIVQLAKKLGPAFSLDPQASFETVTATRRLILRVVGTKFYIEFFSLSDDPHDQQRFARKVRATFSGRETFLPTAEDVIITKLLWEFRTQRNKDKNDVVNVIFVRRDQLDWPYIEQWCDRHGTRALLEEIRRSLPPL